MIELQEHDSLNGTTMSQPTNKQAPPGHRVLHVVVTEEAFNHVKVQAALSGLPVKKYMDRFLREAKPYGRDSADRGMAKPEVDVPAKQAEH